MSVLLKAITTQNITRKSPNHVRKKKFGKYDEDPESWIIRRKGAERDKQTTNCLCSMDESESTEILQAN